MRKVTELTAFILLLIGTICLLVNEFIFDWGRVGTLSFAALNFIGLAILAIMYLTMKDKDRKKED